MNSLLISSITNAWRIVRTKFLFLIPLVIVQIIIIALPEIGNTIIKQWFQSPDLKTMLNFSTPFLALYSSFMTLLNLTLTAIMSMGFIGIALEMLDGKEAWKINDLSKLFRYWRFIPMYIAAEIIYGLMVGIGMLALLIPGIILSIVFALWLYFMVDKSYGPIAALRASMIATRGMRWMLFLYMLVFLIINFLGVLALGVGLFITIPVTAIAMAHIYRQLAARMETVPGFSPVAPPSVLRSPKSKK